MNARYADLLNKKVDKRSAEEIVTDTLKKGGLKLDGRI